MKKLLMWFVLALAPVISAQAALTLTLAPASGTISGSPGQTVGWGFTITSDPTNWLLITSVQGNGGTVGTFEDVLSNFVGINSYALAPNAAAWTESSTPGLGLAAGSIGRIAINAGAAVGSFVTGTMVVTYDLYDGDPFVSGNFVSSGSFDAAYRLDVVAPTNTAIPEPGSVVMVTAGLALVAVQARRARRAARSRA